MPFIDLQGEHDPAVRGRDLDLRRQNTRYGKKEETNNGGANDAHGSRIQRAHSVHPTVLKLMHPAPRFHKVSCEYVCMSISYSRNCIKSSP